MHLSPRRPVPDPTPPTSPTPWPTPVQCAGLAYLRYCARHGVIGVVVLHCDNPCCSPRPTASPGHEAAAPIRVASGTAEAEQAARPRSLPLTRFPLR
ncbi:hypothetical protein [Streptomyces sp. NPDC059224]|uniref:hypothetical protein n=1 Tax=Streptomyces sp. NPDC059224 TaxID=3346775 RepID=UPI00367C1E4E